MGGDASSVLYQWNASHHKHFLDPFLIFGLGPFPAYGVQGAALATGFGILAALVMALFITFGQRSKIVPDRSVVVFDRTLAREIFVLVRRFPVSGLLATVLAY